MNEQIDIIRELSSDTLIRAMEIAYIGCWEWNIQDNSNTWSEEQYRIFGYEHGEIEPTYDHFVNAIHPDDRERVLKAVENVLAGVEPYKIKFRIIRPDKTERIVISQGEVVRDNDNKPVKMIGIVSDITDRMIVHDEFRKNNVRFRAFMDNSTEAIFCVDIYRPLDITLTEDEQIDHLYEYGYISEANNAWAKIAGLKHGTDLIGSTLEDIIPRSISENIAFLKEMIRARYRLNEYETIEHYKTGVKIHASNTITGIIENGHLVRIWGTGRDITKQKRLEEQLLRNEKDLQKLAGRLISNQERECSRIARELHDDLTQQLAVIAIEAGNIEEQFRDLPEPALEKVLQIKEKLIKVSKDVHNLSRDLHPSILYDLGLERALQSECGNFSSRTGIAVIFTSDNIPDNVSKEKALTVYRIVQEGLANILNHAGTKNAYIFLEGSDQSLILTVRDTGAGFDPDWVRHKTSLGLGSIRERVRLVNGTSSITSSPGKGTTIEVKVPLKRE
jgi:PAS domain S-box-containing protein